MVLLTIAKNQRVKSVVEETCKYGGYILSEHFVNKDRI